MDRAGGSNVRPVFFSGGTALRGASRKLIEHTHGSVHVITPFDSGGSSAVLRAAFHMPAVGDLRNRLMALADRSAPGHPEIYALLAHRFSAEGDPARLRTAFHDMVRGDDERVRAVPQPTRSIVGDHLGFFEEAMPPDFDLRGASVGNLVLTGGYLRQGRRLDPVLPIFSGLVRARGAVLPVVDEDLHLVGRLANGRVVVGQHRLTRRERLPLESPVASLFLSRSTTHIRPYRPRIPDAVDSLVRQADLICYPVGSFYTSLVATLLPEGIADAIAETDVPKVYVPNTGFDPEETGLALPDKVRTLVRYLREGSAKRPPVDALLHLVLLDAEASGLGTAQVDEIERMGVRVVDARLVSEESAPYLDDTLLVNALLSLA